MTLSIIEQFDRICADGDGDIICPRCGTEIHQFFHWAVAMNHIEQDRCPICDCQDGCGRYDWCDHCTHWCDGKSEIELENRRWLRADDERKWRREMEDIYQWENAQ